MDTNTDHLLMTQEIPMGLATAYLDTSAHACEVLLALIHQRTERMLQTPVEMARIYHAYWADAARHYAEAANDMMESATNCSPSRKRACIADRNALSTHLCIAR